MMENQAEMPQVLEYGRPERSRVEVVVEEIVLEALTMIVMVGAGGVLAPAFGFVMEWMGLRPVSYVAAWVMGVAVAGLLAWCWLRPKGRVIWLVAQSLMLVASLGLLIWLRRTMPGFSGG